MLRYLRPSMSPMYLWVDAICLNQQDSAEKSSQIPLMGAIYEQASKVHIWLGLDGDGSARKNFAFFRGMCAIHPSNSKHKDAVDGLKKILGENPELQLGNFLARPWFSRRWILQEAALAKHPTVHCGDENQSWLFLKHGMVNLSKILEGSSLNFSDRSVNTLNSFRSLVVGRHHMLDLLWNFHTADCEEPKDRLGALYGLCDETTLNSPNGQHYQYEIWSEFFTAQALEYMLLESGKFFLFHVLAFGSLSERDSSLPSWVPDWTNQRQHVNFISHYPEAKCLDQGITLSNGYGSVQFLNVSYLGHIEYTLSSGDDWSTTLEKLNWFTRGKHEPYKSYIHECIRHQRRHFTRGRVTVCLAASMLSVLHDEFAGYQSLVENVLLSATGIHEMYDNTYEFFDSTFERKVFEQLNETLKAYCLFQTDLGFIGFGPSRLQAAGNVHICFLGHPRSTELEPEFTIGFAIGSLKGEGTEGRLLGPCFLGQEVSTGKLTTRSFEIY
ncbi:heterokaryon incompatibility protein-domain-containing protein [Hypoxylon fuscum]|nr:heterokaryon incompatibility protein-domain-containing protein [Hypoxylon fuscum]